MLTKTICRRWGRALTFAVALGALVPLAGCPAKSTMKKAETSRPRDGKRDRHKEAMETEVKAKEETPSTASYAHINDNPFLSVAAAPRSTFSIDVDTASYSNVRRFLMQDRQLPPPDAVRLEELVNYFPYSYPRPRSRAVAFALDVAECPWRPQHHLVRIALAAKTIDPREMPPRNFVFLIDTSGSMAAPNRLPLLKSALELLVEQLGPRDRVAIVTYAGTAGLALPATPGNDRATILRAIRRLEAAGSTNGGEGIVLAYRIAEQNFIRGGANRVILGTDGDFNVGVSAEGDLVRLIEEKRKSGVFLTVLGFGMNNLKDATLEKLASHGNGHYAYIDTLAEARKVFVEQGGALVTVAKDVKIQVEFNPRRVAGYRLLGYENRLLRDQDFNDDGKDAGDMGSGHTVTALYEIVPAGLPVPAPNVDPLKYQAPAKLAPAAESDEWLTVKLRYKDPDAETSQLLSQALTGKSSKFADASADFRFAASVAAFGMVLRKSPYRGEATYASVRSAASKALGADPNGHRAEFLQLVEAAAEISRGAR